MRDPVTLGQILADKRSALRVTDTKVFNRQNSLAEAKAEQEALRTEIQEIIEEFKANGEAILAGDQTAVFKDGGFLIADTPVTAGADFDAASRTAMDEAFEKATTPNGAVS